jgi:hypothetical protein
MSNLLYGTVAKHPPLLDGCGAKLERANIIVDES